MTDKTDIAALRRPVRDRYDWSNAVWRDCDQCGKQHTGTVTAEDGSQICAHCADQLYWSAWQVLAERTLAQLEAERQQREAAEKERDRIDGRNAELNSTLERWSVQRAESANEIEELRAALRGTQEPDHYHLHTPATGAVVYYPASQKEIVKAIKDDLEGDVVVTELFAHPHKPVVVHPDIVRMDWLCAHVVEVRQPMFYGSHAMFFGQCDSDDCEEYHSKLRGQVDAAIEATGIVGKDGE